MTSLVLDDAIHAWHHRTRHVRLSRACSLFILCVIDSTTAVQWRGI